MDGQRRGFPKKPPAPNMPVIPGLNSVLRDGHGIDRRGVEPGIEAVCNAPLLKAGDEDHLHPLALPDQVSVNRPS